MLNARAETAQAIFDLEQADGYEKIARVTLTEAIGVEPTPEISIDGERNAPLPRALTLPVDQLISRAFADRPDLMARMLEIRKEESRTDKGFVCRASQKGCIGFRGAKPDAT